MTWTIICDYLLTTKCILFVKINIRSSVGLVLGILVVIVPLLIRFVKKAWKVPTLLKQKIEHSKEEESYETFLLELYKLKNNRNIELEYNIIQDMWYSIKEVEEYLNKAKEEWLLTFYMLESIFITFKY